MVHPDLKATSASVSTSPINGRLVAGFGVQYMLTPTADIQHCFIIFHHSNNLQ